MAIKSPQLQTASRKVVAWNELGHCSFAMATYSYGPGFGTVSNLALDEFARNVDYRPKDTKDIPYRAQHCPMEFGANDNYLDRYGDLFDEHR